MKPTLEFYNLFQFIYDYLNENLFLNQLPNCMIVITRKNRTFGYYSKERWVNKEKLMTDELAINPMFFSKYPLIEMLQTMGHEMCHLWQDHFGRASRRSYHNKEWGNKMISIGLMPSNTGKPGGKKTGQQMMDYPIENGIFIKTCAEMIKSPLFEKLWYDRTTTIKILNSNNGISDLQEEMPNTEEEIIEFLYSTFTVEQPLLTSSSDSSKSKYTCHNCDLNVWGKPQLSIICGECGADFEEISINSITLESIKQ
ncbi:SprT-like domain-containing protein [Elizabethkingia miricola]|uniref:SprT-like domain-containing protein n=1 Tax=Elizabethkingia miricola TaxID=172045 RepID=UPI00099AE73C|nr:SprT-like domain-containing protein [Elizabethkingia miricola]OPC06819.1 hypothetical protein BAY01_18525 [Elizabethkingia miricola]